MCLHNDLKYDRNEIQSFFDANWMLHKEEHRIYKYVECKKEFIIEEW